MSEWTQNKSQGIIQDNEFNFVIHELFYWQDFICVTLYEAVKNF